MIKIKVENQPEIEIDSNADGVQLNGQPFDWDISPLGNNRFHILKNSKSYNAEVIEANYPEKTFKIKVNNAIYNLAAKDRFDILLEQMGIGNATKSKVNNIKAPMPGLIWEVKIQVGDVVKVGDVVLVLVAMKMENALKAPGDGVVKTIKIVKGDTVEKNQVLIEFE